MHAPRRPYITAAELRRHPEWDDGPRHCMPWPMRYVCCLARPYELAPEFGAFRQQGHAFDLFDALKRQFERIGG